ncbi:MULTISPECIES: S8 family peptidase [unclassified Aerococcus]|uniref:S8 family peptidase n=1 Tax=unclassified Aerococcus TaxID=2618060 RepID=UPI0008C10E59|nr:MULTISPECIES: S8 family peptidase [unclassified Aerococcus]MDK6856390.1 S8 family peptidase [Aerococcus sp. UMB7533]OFN05345.1 hypothetical protein HMPREF2626_03495 [Aerococcus sp. HMSC062A02]OHO42772.1 hypothetical protein HMPREF2705_02600 [Aerococcus sp. HMSC035B07]
MCNIKETYDSEEKCTTQYATVFLPEKKKDFYSKKLDEYRTSKDSNKFIDSIEDVNRATVHELWTDQAEIPNKNKEACEIWLSVYKKDSPEKVVEEFFSLCEQFEISHYDSFVEFPERVVISVIANFEMLENLVQNTSKIAEIRKNQVPVPFFLRDNDRNEQREWSEELLERLSFDDSNFSICLLDTGVSNGHPLISSVLSDEDMHTVFDDKIVQDKSGSGHGTAMAGIATYYNLERLLDSCLKYNINHHLESVRILKENAEASDEKDIKLYADVTSEAISKVEIQNPSAKRVIAMAVTSGNSENSNNSSGYKADGTPTSWSAGIDNLSLGNYGAEETESRLIIISGGNTSLEEIEDAEDYKTAVTLHSVENPGQSWNALTVGAYTEKALVSEYEALNNYKPIALKSGFSPLTSSSVMWDSKWPIKPEVVFEGGNVGFNKDDPYIKYDTSDHLSLLTANNKFNRGDYFTTFNGTSAATAQASNLAIKIMSRYPDICPQTVRAIMVHSAEWTDEMFKQIFGHNDKKDLNKGEYRALLRTVGYGKPNVEAALYSFDNSANLIVEDEIQPFKKVGNNSPTINEMAIHEIPWPKDVLLSLGNTPVKLKVTLSYFIDPSPGQIGWGDKYRYPGCRLSFDINNINENKEDFVTRINKKAREKAINNGTYQETKNDSNRWLLGTNNRDVGSIHSDVWEDTASNLAENRFIAVYPGGGWWNKRQHLKKYNNKIKYSLIISISTPDEEIDLYTPIQNQINIANRNIVSNQIEH